MQQAHPAEQSTADTHGATLPGAAPLNAFVINLCSSTSPVALAPPDHAGLKRFSFFVSRRREESRERFRLHMGYFDTQEEAEKLLDIVREIYPGAWAGLAPGQRLRAAAAQGVAAPISAAEVAPAQLEPLPGSTPAAMAADAVVDSASAPAAAPTVAAVAPPAAVAAAAAAAAAAVAAAPAVADDVDGTRVSVSALALVPDPGQRMPEGAILKPEVIAATRSLNDVRAAIASLEDTSERAPLLRPLPQLKPAARAASTPHAAAEPMSASGVLAVLEQGAAAASGKAPVADAPPRTDKPYFAVQLMWSVQPMDISQVPQLAIFSAYTLYGAEGNRDGRRWYGLRLGFFTDAVSAKQVAHYVRSEFSTVSVVPVTARERERANLASGRPPLTAPAKPGVDAAAAPNAQAPATPRTKFEFIEDKEPGLLVAKPGGGVPRAAGRAPGKRAKLRTQGSVNSRSRTKPMTLEETLEILGAGELKMDDGRAPLINDSSVAQPRPQPAKNKASRLGRLFERLSERMGS
jgi:hypothetical protein